MTVWGDVNDIVKGFQTGADIKVLNYGLVNDNEEEKEDTDWLVVNEKFDETDDDEW